MALLQKADRTQAYAFFGIAFLIVFVAQGFRFGGLISSSVVLPFWPVIGLMVATLLATSPRQWWAVVAFFGAVDMLVIAIRGSTVPLKLLPLIVVYYGVIILGCWFFKRRHADGPKIYRLSPDLRDFLILALVISLLTGLIDLLRIGLVPGFSIDAPVLQKTMVSNLTSIVIVAPGLLAWLSRPPNARPMLERNALIEIIALVLLVAAIIGMGMSNGSANDRGIYDMPQLLIPLVLWTAFRFDFRVTAFVLLVIAVYVTAQLAFGTGPFARISSDPAAQALAAGWFLAGNGVGFLVFSSFVATTRRQAMEGQQAQTFLKQFAAALGASYFVVNRDLKGFEYMEGVEERRGPSTEQLKNDMGIVFQILHPEDRDRIENVWTQILQGTLRQPFEVGFRIVPKPGEVYYERSLVAPLFDADGGITRYAGIVYDVTDEEILRATQAELRDIIYESDKLHSIGVLGAGLAHDWNNLLFVLATGTDELERHVRANPELEETVETFRELAAQGAGICNDMLSLAQRDPAPLVVVNLQEEVDRSLALLQRSLLPNIRLATHSMPTPELRVRMRSSYVHQIVLNLGLNARDAIGKEGGSISIKVEGPFVGELLGTEQSYATLTVADDGPGMTDDIKDRIFEPLYTTKAERGGTGLGMSVVSSLVAEMNGSIEVESAPGEGTTITISFPNYAG